MEEEERFGGSASGEEGRRESRGSELGGRGGGEVESAKASEWDGCGVCESVEDSGIGIGIGLDSAILGNLDVKGSS